MAKAIVYNLGKFMKLFVLLCGILLGSSAFASQNCSDEVGAFIKQVASEYGETEGGTYLGGGIFNVISEYDQSFTIIFSNNLSNPKASGRLTIKFRVDQNCQIDSKEITLK